MEYDKGLNVLDLEHVCNGFEFKSKHKATNTEGSPMPI